MGNRKFRLGKQNLKKLASYKHSTSIRVRSDFSQSSTTGLHAHLSTSVNLSPHTPGRITRTSELIDLRQQKKSKNDAFEKLDLVSLI